MLSDNIIRKHVAIIHAYSLMSSLQRKVVNVLLNEAINNTRSVSQEDSTTIECRTSFSNILKAVNFNSNNTKYFKEEIDKLASLKIEWNLLRDKVPAGISFLNLRVLQGSPTFNKDGTFNFAFHKVMFDLMKQPAIYGSIDLDIQSQFESKYSHSLYENSTRLVNLQKNKVIQLDIYRKLMGVDADKYHCVRELTRNVVKPSIEEVNDRANFVVELEPVKVGRKIAGFEVFVAGKKKVIPLSKSVEPSLNESLYSEINQAFGSITETVLENIIRSYSEKYILEKITYTKQHAKIEASGFYPIPYFISALKHDYKSYSQNQNQIKKPSNDVTQQWHEKSIDLEYELKYWQEQSFYAHSEKDSLLVASTQKYIRQCEEKLRQHLLEKSSENKETV